MASAVLGVLACVGGWACDGYVEQTSPPWLESPEAALPATLAEVGLFPHRTADGALDRSRLHTRAIEVTPQYPLWSSGSEKARHVVLPDGAQVDASQEPWIFPEGTAIFKTFGYEGTPVETRALLLTAEGWDFGVYRWHADGADADLLELRAPEVVAVPGADHEHTIPSRLQCRKCHESAASHVLGLGSLQLADQLDGLATEGFFSTAPAPPAAIDTGSALTDAVIGYVQGNCVHCHTGGDGINNGYDMRPAVFESNTVGVEAVGYSAAVPLRVAPSDPTSSLLWLALSGETDDPEVEDMPPLGVDVRDAEAIVLVRDWIESL